MSARRKQKVGGRRRRAIKPIPIKSPLKEAAVSIEFAHADIAGLAQAVEDALGEFPTSAKSLDPLELDDPIDHVADAIWNAECIVKDLRTALKALKTTRALLSKEWRGRRAK